MDRNRNNREYNEMGSHTSEDIEKNKTMAALAYLLFFLPLIVCPDSEFGKFHANQALILWIVGIVGGAVLGFVPFIGWIITRLLSAFLLIIGILGMINAFNGKAEELPIIGGYRIIK